MTNIIPKNNMERKALELLKAGKPIHGELRDLLIDMQLREKKGE